MDDTSTGPPAGAVSRPPRRLEGDEARAWVGLRLMRRSLDARLYRDLARDAGLSEPDYDVLSNLADRPERRWRMSDLGDHLYWSRSRLSHHVSRMEERGLVIREEVEEDGRGAFVGLTDEGLKAIRDAAPLHVASVRRNFLDLLHPEELRMLGDIAERVLDHLRATRPP